MSDAEHDTDQTDSGAEGGSILDRGGIDTDARAGRSLGIDPYQEPDEEHTGRQLVWLRAHGPVPDDPLLHRALLAYACDQVMLEPVLRHAGLSWSSPGLSLASLDHAMWWHRDARVDEWLLFVQSSPSAQGGRGLSAARVFDEAGTLVASIAQEGMVRVPRT